MTAKGIPANAKQLAALVKEGEGPALEFKRSTGELKEGMQTLCALQRNPIIADVFYKTGLIEKWGRETGLLKCPLRPGSRPRNSRRSQVRPW